MSSQEPLPDKPALPPAIRRFVTGNTTSGRATVVCADTPKPRALGPHNLVYDLGRTERVPARVDAQTATGEGGFVDEILGHPEIVTPLGAIFRAVDYAPGSVTPFHRTQSLDYAIVVSGSIVLQLNDGERHVLRAGDVVVQRSTIHAFRNESADEWARMYSVVCGAEPVVVNDKELKEVFLPPPPGPA